MSMSGLLDSKIALITGASQGIGAAVAKRFAKEGAHVILVSRNLAELKQIDDEIKKFDGIATLVQLDLLEFVNIKELAMSINSKFNASLDILVASAAILGELCPIQDYNFDMWKSIMDTNFNANWHLIKHLDPLLKAANAGRVIFVTSDVAPSPSLNPYWGAYAASKAALEVMAKVYAAETKHCKLCINMVCPGLINSGIFKQAFPGQDTSELPLPEELTDKFVELASENCNVTGEIFKLNPSEYSIS